MCWKRRSLKWLSILLMLLLLGWFWLIVFTSFGLVLIDCFYFFWVGFDLLFLLLLGWFWLIVFTSIDLILIDCFHFFWVDFDWLFLLLLGWLLPVWGSCKSTSKILPWGLCTRLASLILRSTYNTCKDWWKWKWPHALNHSTDQLTLLRKLHSSGAKLRDQAALETSFELLSMLYFLHTSTT